MDAEKLSVWNRFKIWIQEFLIVESEHDFLYRKWAKEDFTEVEQPKLSEKLNELRKL